MCHRSGPALIAQPHAAEHPVCPTHDPIQALFEAIRRLVNQGISGQQLWAAVQEHVFRFLMAEAAARIARGGRKCRSLDPGTITSGVMEALEKRYQKAVIAGRVGNHMFGSSYDPSRPLENYIAGILRREVKFAVARAVGPARRRPRRRPPPLRAVGPAGAGGDPAQPDVTDDEPPPEQQAGDAEAAAMVQDAVNHLPDTERKLVIEWMQKSVSITKAGNEIGLRKSQASVRFRAALDRLRDALRKYKPDDR